MDIAQKIKDDDWFLCIFFSVDIEDATAYKIITRNRSDDVDWFVLFAEFYEEFPQYFYKAYLHLSTSQSLPTEDLLTPVLWKFNGDEILFYVPVTNSIHTLEHIRAFYNTIIKYNEKLQKYNVQCKGTAWVAGFPVNNRGTVIVRDKKEKTYSIDFVGSSIDTGFRLTKFSSPRKLVVSLDLLWLLAESRLTCNDAIFSFLNKAIYYAGRHELKGVLSGKPYPIFWLDTFVSPPVEDRFSATPISCNLNDIIKFCEEFSFKFKDFIRPFIVDDTSKKFGEIPEYSKQQRDILISYKKKKENLRVIPDGTDNIEQNDPSVTGVNKLT
ncbi:MAG: hypothetical protein LBE12_16030 [Planctomycetaceae bacterium]|jgi:hypothetical protein|nr:hypothetical protein [Planctomycetaceae bacterium]